jgi:hypothetical protein
MARYDRLIDLLSSLGEKNLKIQKVILVKFGSLLFAESSKSPEQEEADTKEPEEPRELPRNVGTLVYEALKIHPNIFEPEQVREEEAEEAEGSSEGFFVKGSFYNYRIHLPKAKHKYKDMESSEHFSVVSRGSLFAAYCEVERVPIWSNIGHEFRELAREQIEKVTQLKCPNIGPCPIHPDIVIVVRDDEQDEKDTFPKRYLNDDDIFIVVSDPRPTVDLVVDCFFDFGFALERFYDLALSRNDAIDTSTEMSVHFGEASGRVEELLQTPSWKIWETHAVARKARISVAMVHTSLVDLESQLLYYERDRAETLDSLKKDRDARLLFEYFQGMTALGIAVPPSLTVALGFFESELQLYGNIRSLLYASLIGAIVGSLLSGFLSYLALKQ